MSEDRPTLPPRSDVTIVAFRQVEGGEWLYYRVGADKDPFEVCNRAARRVCPDAQIRNPDLVFERLMQKRRKDGIRA